MTDSSSDGPAVSLRSGTVRVGGRTIWSDVDVRVERGHFVAVLGPNGVGKSTLIKTILGEIPLAAGEMRVLGQPAGRANGAIGYVPQRRAFDAGLRLRAIDLVQLGRDGDRW